LSVLTITFLGVVQEEFEDTKGAKVWSSQDIAVYVVFFCFNHNRENGINIMSVLELFGERMSSVELGLSFYSRVIINKGFVIYKIPIRKV
jgi:hypothetical protein